MISHDITQRQKASHGTTDHQVSSTHSDGQLWLRAETELKGKDAEVTDPATVNALGEPAVQPPFVRGEGREQQDEPPCTVRTQRAAEGRGGQ